MSRGPAASTASPQGTRHLSSGAVRALFVSLIAALALAPASARAIVSHTLSSTFGSGELNFPIGIAVNNSPNGSPGEVYVVDLNNQRVAKFKADRTPDGEIGTSNITGPNCAGANGFSAPVFVATDPSSGDVYVSDEGAAAVTAFAPSGECLFQINSSNSMPSGADVSGVAVDPIHGPDGADGTIYLANRNGSQIEEFDATSRVLTGSFPVPPGTIRQLDALALDPSGHLYVVNWRAPGEEGSDPEHGIVAEYDPSSGGLLGVLDNTNAQAVAVDAADGHVFVEEDGPDSLDNPACGRGCAGNHFQHAAYNQLADFRSPIESTPGLTFGKDDLPVGPGNNGGYGLAVNESTDTVYLTDPGTYTVHAYGSSVTVPDVFTGSALSPDHASATLEGHIDPDTPNGGTAITSCYFQYGTDTTYSGLRSGTVPCSPDPASNPPSSNFSAATDVSAEIQGLQTLTFYHYRLVATNANSVPTYGADQTVRPLPDLPTVSTTSASAVGQEEATIESVIDPGYGPTVYRVEYGTDTSYGSNTVFGESIGADGVSHPVSSRLSGLLPATTYHYRVRAVNFSGVDVGPDQTFNTTAPPSVTVGSSSAVTQTSAALSAQVNPDFSLTTYHFDYGVGTGYGSTTTESAPIGSDHINHSAAAVISGLVPGTTYHFRIVATNIDGSTAGPDQTFTTEPGTIVEPPIEPKCKRGLVKRRGKCVKKVKHHRSGQRHG
jgi:hypothetical protein